MALPNGGQALRSLKALWALRALWPLRVVSWNEGLKLVVNSLFSALPAMLNVMLVCLLFVLIFAILGMNFFKGEFYHCELDDWKLLEKIETNIDCLNYGGKWENADSNFDNLISSSLTLFEMMTTEGWITVMNQGVDAWGINT